MATKKSSKRAGSKKSSSTKTTRVTKKTLEEPAEEKVLAAEAEQKEAETTEPEAVEVVEVEEVVEPAKKDDKKAEKKEKRSVTDRLADLNPAAMLVEAFGTFILSAVILRLVSNTSYGLPMIALTLAVLVVVFGAISGAHLNPAISIAAWINKKIDGVRAFGYIVAQLVGAALAILVVTGLTNANYDLGNALRQMAVQSNVATESEIDKDGVEAWAKSYLKNNGTTEIPDGKTAVEYLAEQTGLDKNSDKGIDVSAQTKVYTQPKLAEGKEWAALLAEIVGTIVFGFGVGFALFSKRKCVVAKGLAVGFGLLAGLTVAGATAILNPAVAIALGAYHWGDLTTTLWPIVVYVLGAIVGMTLGVFIYRMLARNSDNAEEEFEA